MRPGQVGTVGELAVQPASGASVEPGSTSLVPSSAAAVVAAVGAAVAAAAAAAEAVARTEKFEGYSLSALPGRVMIIES